MARVKFGSLLWGGTTRAVAEEPIAQPPAVSDIQSLLDTHKLHKVDVEEYRRIRAVRS